MTIPPITKEERAEQPAYDLEGALNDLKRANADAVCLRTIERAVRNLHAYEARVVQLEALWGAVLLSAVSVRGWIESEVEHEVEFPQSHHLYRNIWMNELSDAIARIRAVFGQGPPPVRSAREDRLEAALRNDIALFEAIADPENEPDDDAVDAVLVIDVWRKEAAERIAAARRALGEVT